jgi:signal transduction histidine kinase
MQQLSARPSGIAAVGDIPWGTHFCQFYRTGADLADTLVPFFEAGLRSNEACLWVTGSNLEADAAETLMIEAVPEFKKRLSGGQMQIVSIRDWYTPGDDFDPDVILQGWLDREAESQRRGFSGLRLTGDTFWVERSGWDNFMEYENKVNKSFRRYNLVALCTYCMDKCTAGDVVEVCCQHQFALARVRGEWELLESASLKIAKEQLMRQNLDLEQRVQARTSELNTALKARDEFLAMLGHELRNPLAPIMNASQLIRTQTPPDSPVNRSAAIVSRQAEHMSRLVSDLLDVGRITQGQLRLDLSEVSLCDVLEQAVEQSRPLIDQREHSLSLALPSRNVKVKADPVRLAQVFANLLHNAAKYTPNGGSVGIHADVHEGKVTVSVRDTGSGIPPEMLESIFELFTQLPRSLARSDGGLGIGLTLVKRLTEMHEGSVSASSGGTGAGSEFTVTLPTVKSVKATAQEVLPVTPMPLVGCRVLIIDDNEDANESTGMLLESAGHRTAAAYDGPSGLALARRLLPDAVLLDIGLPGMDGYEVARQLKAEAETRHIFVIALTGYGKGADVDQAREAGIDHHLLKPARPEDIFEQLAHLMSRKMH